MVRNTEALLDASVEVLSERGWAGFTFAGVGDRAGLSRRTLQDRFPSPSALAVAVWAQRCSPALEADLRAILGAAGLIEGEVAGEQALVGALDRVTFPAPLLDATGELFVMSLFDADLRRSLGRTLSRPVVGWCAPGRGAVARGDAGRRGFLVSLALGLLIAARSGAVGRDGIVGDRPIGERRGGEGNHAQRY